ncbi:hypothetical protein Zmor_028263 [Zophobas morio]|uniref:Uncharacterized protein n=1 Tax=Zophobas morio TaxID=2755281 RepID=A0AA38HPX3_9CUCU|nr:hypothetical protein Zmor_028263 [Zophobas morio]
MSEYTKESARIWRNLDECERMQGNLTRIGENWKIIRKNSTESEKIRKNLIKLSQDRRESERNEMNTRAYAKIGENLKEYYKIKEEYKRI